MYTFGLYLFLYKKQQHEKTLISIAMSMRFLFLYDNNTSTKKLSSGLYHYPSKGYDLRTNRLSYGSNE